MKLNGAVMERQNGSSSLDGDYLNQKDGTRIRECVFIIPDEDPVLPGELPKATLVDSELLEAIHELLKRAEQIELRVNAIYRKLAEVPRSRRKKRYRRCL